ncbi:MAG: phytanoyl-CoA dioxygenase [Sphingobacterium sp.]
MSDLLNNKEIQQFIQDGFIRIDNAFSEEVAMNARQILWNDLPLEESKPEQWTEPVIWLGMYSQQPFLDSVNSKVLHQIFDQLVGQDNWLPCRSVGSFPVRFPVASESNDTGIHVDASFPGKDPSNLFEWRVNVKSKGRALLMLILYSDVSEKDAPTVIYKGSHMDVACILSGKGDEGLSFMELAERLHTLPTQDTVQATGKAGTIYLCHPFLAHSAQAHKGRSPKFMAQPPLLLRNELKITSANPDVAPVVAAIQQALK